MLSLIVSNIELHKLKDSNTYFGIRNVSLKKQYKSTV